MDNLRTLASYYFRNFTVTNFPWRNEIGVRPAIFAIQV
jgi:hypothetical protein